MTHAQLRAKERYGIDLTFDDLEALQEQCRNGESLLLANLTDGQMHLVRHNGTAMKAVYAPENGRIVTFIAMNQTRKDRKPPGKQKRIKRRPYHHNGKACR